MTPLMSLSRVLLPEPLSPSSPERLALLHGEADLVEGLEGVGELPAAHGEGRQLLERAAAAQHEGLGDGVDLDGGDRH
jgi:hypothetical protein